MAAVIYGVDLLDIDAPEDKKIHHVTLCALL